MATEWPLKKSAMAQVAMADGFSKTVARVQVSSMAGFANEAKIIPWKTVRPNSKLKYLQKKV